MKTLIYSLTSLNLLVCPILAGDKDLIQTKLISTTITPKFPEEISSRHLRPGAKLVFFFQADNIVSFDKQSFFVDGWDKHFEESIAPNRKSAFITITNSNFKGHFEEIEAEGRVDVQLGTELITKKIILKKGANPVKFPFFTMHFRIREDNNDSVYVEGQHQIIKSISILRDGKETKNSSWGYTYYFKDIKDGDEIKVVYWNKLKTKSVKLYK